MRPFTYSRAASESDAIQATQAAPAATFVAGGTSLLDLMKLGVMTPDHLVDINRLALSSITIDPSNAETATSADAGGGSLRIGALARNTEVAEHPQIRSRYRALSEALLSGASPQLRNMASVSGNLLQRTRCTYFRDVESAAPCNKRSPGSGCSAIDGFNRMHAVLGVSDRCIAANPSDMNVALAALDAVVVVRGAAGERSIPITDFHLTPGEHPEKETVLMPGDLVVAVLLPPTPWFAQSRYVKVRDRASYAFALTSAAVAMDIQAGVIGAARIAIGGVGTKPWRAAEAEASLVGRAPGSDVYRAAAEVALRGAVGREHNSFKIELAKRTIVRALALSAATPATPATPT